MSKLLKKAGGTKAKQQVKKGKNDKISENNGNQRTNVNTESNVNHETNQDSLNTSVTSMDPKIADKIDESIEVLLSIVV